MGILARSGDAMFIDLPSELEEALIGLGSALPAWSLEGTFLADSTIERYRAELASAPLFAQEIAAADAVVLLTDHTGFDYDAILQHAPFVLDCRNRLSGANVDVL